MPSTAYLRRLYNLYAPVYDVVVGPAFERARRQSLSHFVFRPGLRVLIVGGGTGLDLSYLPDDAAITIVDVSRGMLARAQQRAERMGLAVTFVEGSADALPFEDASFDAIVLHFILAVVPDAGAALREATRVLVPGGRMAILDKMAPENKPLSFSRRALNVVSPWVATGVTLRLGPLLKANGLKKRLREKVGPFGLFRAVSAVKPRTEASSGHAAEATP